MNWVPWWVWVTLGVWAYGLGFRYMLRVFLKDFLKDFTTLEGWDLFLIGLMALVTACVAPIIWFGKLYVTGRDWDAIGQAIAGQSRADRRAYKAKRVKELEQRNAELERLVGIDSE